MGLLDLVVMSNATKGVARRLMLSLLVTAIL